MPSHSPAPWQVGDEQALLLYDADGALIADLEPSHDDDGAWLPSGELAPAAEARCLANGRLFAAAPDLLEALKDLLQFEKDEHGGSNRGAGYEPHECLVCTAVNHAYAAIAKAEGGQ